MLFRSGEDAGEEGADGPGPAAPSRAVAGAALLVAMLALGTVFRESPAISRAAGAAAGSVEIQGDSAVQTKKFGSDVMLGVATAASITRTLPSTSAKRAASRGLMRSELRPSI